MPPDWSAFGKRWFIVWRGEVMPSANGVSEANEPVGVGLLVVHHFEKVQVIHRLKIREPRGAQRTLRLY
jgi:hypothetical protein